MHMPTPGCKSAVPTRRELLSLAALALLTPRLPGVEDAQPSAKEQDDKKKSLQLMLGQAKEMLVQTGERDDLRKCELREKPLIHYSDQVRRLPESTLWIWEQRGLPVLFCKVERLVDAAGVTKSWQYCCVPATPDKIDVTWGRKFRWRAREQSFRWLPLPDAPEPRDQPRARLLQMRAIARGFSGRTEQTPAMSQQEMRLLASPLHQYSSPEDDVLDGAVFGLTCNGTNPDALVLIEALVKPEAKSKWRFAVVGMTGDAVEVLNEKAKVWSKPYSDGPGDYRSWMWYLAAP